MLERLRSFQRGTVGLCRSTCIKTTSSQCWRLEKNLPIGQPWATRVDLAYLKNWQIQFFLSWYFTGSIVSFPNMDRFNGTCWTLTNDSPAMQPELRTFQNGIPWYWTTRVLNRYSHVFQLEFNFWIINSPWKKITCFVIKHAKHVQIEETTKVWKQEKLWDAVLSLFVFYLCCSRIPRKLDWTALY